MGSRGLLNHGRELGSRDQEDCLTTSRTEMERKWSPATPATCSAQAGYSQGNTWSSESCVLLEASHLQCLWGPPRGSPGRPARESAADSCGCRTEKDTPSDTLECGLLTD